MSFPNRSRMLFGTSIVKYQENLNPHGNSRGGTLEPWLKQYFTPHSMSRIRLSASMTPRRKEMEGFSRNKRVDLNKRII